MNIRRCTDSRHKYIATFIIYSEKAKSIDSKLKVVKFGAAGYEDFTTHHDVERKKRYLKRHKFNENWDDPISPGALSRFILWNKRTIRESV